jgi:hypothetical protein
MAHTQMSSEMQQCIENCQNCHAVCLETISHCLQMGGEHASASHIKLLQDCVQICQTSADFMIRGSNFHAQTCGVCADVCAACADHCEKMATGEMADVMQRCADACRRCAESCREMSQSASTASM